MMSKTLEKLIEELEEADSNVFILEGALEELKREVNELREHAKEQVDASLRAENESLRKELSLVFGRFDSQKELKSYISFCKKHSKCGCSPVGVYSSYLPYVKQANCGVGITSTVVCPVCGKSKDITDISAW